MGFATAGTGYNSMTRGQTQVTGAGWLDKAAEYEAHIADAERDSQYLRDVGLKPGVLRMTGPCGSRRVLDVGCADGWLLDALNPAEGYGCDLQCYSGFSNRWNFSIQDVQRLSYPDSYFDVTVASLLLIWVSDLATALREIHRVTRPSGRVVISLMYPDFYRTGEVTADGHFMITRPLGTTFTIDDHRIAGQIGPFRYHYRPLSTYLNECIRAGLCIAELAEWFVDIEEYRSRFGSDMAGQIRRTGEVPMYSFIRCRRE